MRVGMLCLSYLMLWALYHARLVVPSKLTYSSLGLRAQDYYGPVDKNFGPLSKNGITSFLTILSYYGSTST